MTKADAYTMSTEENQPAVNTGSPEVAQAFAVLRQAMHDDPEYAWSWHCNIAMASVDEGRTHFQANRAAARFMQNCFGIDITKSEQWASLGLDKTPAPTTTAVTHRDIHGDRSDETRS